MKAMSMLTIALFIVTVGTSCASTNGVAKISKNSFLYQGNEYARDGLFRESVAQYKKSIESENKKHVANRNLGMVYVKMGMYKKAEDHLRQALSQYQNNFECNFYLGEALRAQSDYAEAIFHYQKANKIRPNDLKNLKSLTWSYFKIRYYGAAYKLAKKITKIKPNDEQTNVIMARTLIKLKKPKTALRIISKIYKQSTPQAKPYLNSVKGDILFSMGEYGKALMSYKRALKGNPMLAGSLLGVGEVLLKKGDSEGARKHIARAVRLRPSMVKGHLVLAKLYESDNRKKAIYHYKKFAKLGFTDPEFIEYVAEAKSKIMALKKGPLVANSKKTSQQ